MDHKSNHSKASSWWNALLIVSTLLILTLVGIEKFQLVNVAKQTFRHDYVNNPSDMPSDDYYETTITFWEQGEVVIPPHRTPIVPLFYLGLSLISRNYSLIPFTQGILFLIAIGVLCLSFWRLFGWTTGLVTATAFISFTSQSTVMNPHSEALSLVFLIYAVCCLAFAWAQQQMRYLLLGCFICSLAILSRPALTFLLPLTGFVIALFMVNFRVRVRSAVGAGLLLFIPILLWMTYNAYRGTTFSISNYTWLTLASVSLPYMTDQVSVDENLSDDPLVVQGVHQVYQVFKTGYGGKLDEYMKSADRIEDPNCASYLEMPYCIRSDSMLVRYHLNTINYNVWVVMAGIVINELGVKNKLEILRVMDGISRVIVMDVIEHNHAPLLRIVKLNFWTTLGEGYLPSIFTFLTIIIGLIFSMYSKRSVIGTLGFLCMLLASIHLLHVIIISIFGGPLPRYYLLTRSFVEIVPVMIIGVVVDAAWNKWRLRHPI